MALSFNGTLETLAYKVWCKGRRACWARCSAGLGGLLRCSCGAGRGCCTRASTAGPVLARYGSQDVPGRQLEGCKRARPPVADHTHGCPPCALPQLCPVGVHEGDLERIQLLVCDSDWAVQQARRGLCCLPAGCCPRAPASICPAAATLHGCAGWRLRCGQCGRWLSQPGGTGAAPCVPQALYSSHGWWETRDCTKPGRCPFEPNPDNATVQHPGAAGFHALLGGRGPQRTGGGAPATLQLHLLLAGRGCRQSRPWPLPSHAASQSRMPRTRGAQRHPRTVAHTCWLLCCWRCAVPASMPRPPRSCPPPPPRSHANYFESSPLIVYAKGNTSLLSGQSERRLRPSARGPAGSTLCTTDRRTAGRGKGTQSFVPVPLPTPRRGVAGQLGRRLDRGWVGGASLGSALPAARQRASAARGGPQALGDRGGLTPRCAARSRAADRTLKDPNWAFVPTPDNIKYLPTVSAAAALPSARTAALPAATAALRPPAGAADACGGRTRSAVPTAALSARRGRPRRRPAAAWQRLPCLGSTPASAACRRAAHSPLCPPARPAPPDVGDPGDAGGGAAALGMGHLPRQLGRAAGAAALHHLLPRPEPCAGAAGAACLGCRVPAHQGRPQALRAACLALLTRLPAPPRPACRDAPGVVQRHRAALHPGRVAAAEPGGGVAERGVRAGGLQGGASGPCLQRVLPSPPTRCQRCTPALQLLPRGPMALEWMRGWPFVPCREERPYTVKDGGNFTSAGAGSIVGERRCGRHGRQPAPPAGRLCARGPAPAAQQRPC